MIYRFGEFSLDIERLELRGKAGPVAIEPQVFSLLVYLIENRNRVVSKDDLFEHVWQGRIVSDATLNSRINSARRAVGDNGTTQSVIRTYPRRGFRFIGTVQINGSVIERASRSSDRDPGLPAKPSIAVLPFDNMSDDAKQEYFADGIAEDVITALAKFRWFFVIARNSSFSYKGQSVGIKQVAHELGVQYVLEGSVRKAANRVRITAQLIDATTGHHVWADRYDRDLEDIFAVQDEITRMIITSLAPEYLSAEVRRAQRKDEKHLDSWDLVMRAHWHLTKFDKTDNQEAQRLLTKAIELDTGSALAYSSLAFSHVYCALFGWSESARKSISTASDAARRAVAIDDRDCWAQATLARVDLLHNQHDASIDRLAHAIELNPNDPYAYGQLGLTLGLSGEPDQAVAQVEQAIRLSPRDPLVAVWYGTLAITLFYAEDFEAAETWARKATQQNPQHAASYRILVAACAALGKNDEAESALTQLFRLQPHLTIGAVRDQAPPTKDPANKERYLDALRKAGLPE